VSAISLPLPSTPGWTRGWISNSTPCPVNAREALSEGLNSGPLGGGRSYTPAVRLDPAIGLGEPDDGASVRRTLRWTLPLALLAIGFLIAVTFRAQPSPGLHGQHLAISASLILFAAALVAFEQVPATARAWRISFLGVMVLCGSIVFALQADGPGFLMMYPPLAAAAFRFPRAFSVGVAGIGLLGLACAATFGRSRPFDLVVLDVLAVAGYFGVATFAGRFIIADERSQFVIDQLERTRAAQAEAAALSERQRLAREMHDVLAHSLSGLVLNLEGARLMAERGIRGAELDDVLSRSHGLAKTGLEEARRAIGMLRDDALPGPQRLAALSGEFQADTGVPCHLMVSGDERDLSSDCRLTLYRVTQEALTNIRKHARPDMVEVSLSYEPDGARLVIEDFSSSQDRPPPGDGTGYGLTGMRERAELLGGSLDAHRTDHGFRVEMWAPA
jgi:signal transduction histidine kinase